MTPILYRDKPTILKYQVHGSDAHTACQHRMIIEDSSYGVHIPGNLQDDVVAFHVPPIANLLEPGKKTFVWETLSENKRLVAMTGEVEVEPHLNEDKCVTHSDGVNDTWEQLVISSGKLPESATIDNNQYSLQSVYGNYGLYAGVNDTKWVVYESDTHKVLVFDDLLQEADQLGSEQFNKTKQDILNRVIGPVVEISISGLVDNQPIESKVDTGATCCSIDAQDIKIIPDSYERDHELVFFTFRGVKYRAMIDHYQVVTTADGTSNRPAVVFNVTCNGQLVENVAFNLDDRSAMNYDVLLGMNFLDSTNFLIDPSKALHENISVELLDCAFQTIMEHKQQ